MSWNGLDEIWNDPTETWNGPAETYLEFIFNYFKDVDSGDPRLLNECPLCFNSYKGSHPAAQVTNVPGCNHVFGRECLFRWLTSNNRNYNTCPSCRTPLYGVSLERVDEINEGFKREVEDWRNSVTPALSEEELARRVQLSRDDMLQQLDAFYAEHRRNGGTEPVTQAQSDEWSRIIRDREYERARHQTGDLDRGLVLMARNVEDVRRWVKEADETRKRQARERERRMALWRTEI
ncbi:hypothetical protein BU16DRAFT_594645 [Lophium mytilinum]|uniref:RING-type domain-containing protein n=1 Tax=Lophium mytilinum TaxID=390894 RepID=A0A6A6QHY0_9PEZI|nr:hypothetical protein BU16DRAFT_594645 [Lophium mytilinum]